jgi:hypothetical protein
LVATDEFHKKKVQELIKHTQWITQRDTAVKLGISQECVGHCCSSVSEGFTCEKEIQNPGFGKETHGYSFLGCR